MSKGRRRREASHTLLVSWAFPSATLVLLGLLPHSSLSSVFRWLSLSLSLLSLIKMLAFEFSAGNSGWFYLEVLNYIKIHSQFLLFIHLFSF